MEYVYSAMLLHSAGQEINDANLKKVIKASGAKVDEARVKALVASLKDINIDEAIKTAAPVAAAPAAAEAPATAEAPAEEKKGEKKEKEKPEDEEKAQEDAASGLASLFG